MKNLARSDGSAHASLGEGAAESASPEDPSDTAIRLIPRIYVVTACFNGERTIGDALESVLSQLEFVAQHVIVDGVSTDDTLAVIKRYAPRYVSKLTVVSEPDNGIYDAMNKGIRECLRDAEPGDFIATLNTDDRYEPDAFRLIAESAQHEPEVDAFFGDLAVLDSEGRPTGRTRRSVRELTRESCSDGMPIEHPTMFVRADTYRRLGFYDESYAIAADYEFVLRMAEAGVSTRHVGATLTGFRYGGLSTTDESASFKEAIRARVAHGASPTHERTRYAKRRLFGLLFRMMRWVPGLGKFQARFGASARRGERNWNE